MTRRWKTERTITIVFAIAVGIAAVAVASCEPLMALPAAAQNVAPSPVPTPVPLPTGLPWAAMTVGLMVLLQLVNIGVTYAKGSAARIAKVENELRAEVRTVEAVLGGEVKSVLSSLDGLKGGIRSVLDALVKAINDERLSRYESDAQCASKHGESVPHRPKLLTIPDPPGLKSGD
jgi:hypothetical protein